MAETPFQFFGQSPQREEHLPCWKCRSMQISRLACNCNARGNLRGWQLCNDCMRLCDVSGRRRRRLSGTLIWSANKSAFTFHSRSCALCCTHTQKCSCTRQYILCACVCLVCLRCKRTRLWFVCVCVPMYEMPLHFLLLVYIRMHTQRQRGSHAQTRRMHVDKQVLTQTPNIWCNITLMLVCVWFV